MTSRCNPYGIISPTTIIAKMMYCDICDSKILCGKTLPDWLVKKWKKWEKKLPTKVNISRTIKINLSQEEMIHTHVSEDASLLETSAVAFAAIQQPS